MSKPKTEIYINGEPVLQPETRPQNQWNNDLEFLMREIENRFGEEARNQFANHGIVHFAEKYFGIPPAQTIETLNNTIAQRQQAEQDATIQVHADAVARDIGLKQESRRPSIFAIAKMGFNKGFNNR